MLFGVIGLFRGQLGNLLRNAHMIVALLEGDASLKILMTAQAAEVRAEGTVLQPPFGTAQGAPAADLTVEVHLPLIDAGILQITDVVVLEGHAAIEIIVADIQILFQQLRIIQRLEAQGAELRVVIGAVQAVVLKGDPQRFRAGGQTELMCFVAVAERSLTVLLQVHIIL